MDVQERVIMLEIYKNLFDQLNNSKIAYSVYKSLNHLDEDLNGIRGDIDILLNEKELSGFPGNSLFGLNPNMN